MSRRENAHALPADRLVVRPGAASAGNVLVARGLLGDAGEILKLFAPAHRYAIITDSNVARLYGERTRAALHGAGLVADTVSIEPGEANKTRETWSRVTDALFDLGLGRDACVVALGGGVVGDLAGFVAATYTRGIDVVQVPTTLLAMIDASIGGKTGVDVPAGKNLVGAFHAPRVVIIDPDLVGTLPAEEYRTGLAEAVKHGAIADEAYLRWQVESSAAILARAGDALERLITRSVEIKLAIVGEDPLESGRRATLNFGHTIGHALEKLSEWELPHGHAIAIGMVAEARLGEALGIARSGTSAELASALAAFALPTTLPTWASPDQIAAATTSDKKARAGGVRFALIARPGAAAQDSAGQWTVAIDGAVVTRLLADQPR